MSLRPFQRPGELFLPADQATYDAVLQLPWAHMGIRLGGERITTVKLSTTPLSESTISGPLARHVGRCLIDYLQGGEWPSGLPLAPAGTPFQLTVWERLLAIPPGETRTYGDIASELGTSPRAVGGACRANPIVLLIPCHRVVAASGEGGFAGQRSGTWPAIKHRLLVLEGAVDD